MDVYTFAALVATIVAIALRRFVFVRVLAVAFLLWIGFHQQLNIHQAERMLMMRADAPSYPTPDLEIVGVLQRTPAGFVAFLCAGVLALVPVRPPGERHS